MPSESRRGRHVHTPARLVRQHQYRTASTAHTNTDSSTEVKETLDTASSKPHLKYFAEPLMYEWSPVAVESSMFVYCTCVREHTNTTHA